MDIDGLDDLEGSTRDIAVKALTHILMHERICASRWKAILNILICMVGFTAAQFFLKLFDFVHIGPAALSIH